jgi:hypothetical protein
MITKILYIQNDDGEGEIESYVDLSRFGHITINDVFESHIVITDRGRIFKNHRGETFPVNSFDLVAKPLRKSKYRSIFDEKDTEQQKNIIVVPKKEQSEEKTPVYLLVMMKFLPVTWDELNIGDAIYYKIKDQLDDNAHGPFMVHDKEKSLILTQSNTKIKVTDRLDLLKLDYSEVQ